MDFLQDMLELAWLHLSYIHRVLVSDSLGKLYLSKSHSYWIGAAAADVNFSLRPQTVASRVRLIFTPFIAYHCSNCSMYHFILYPYGHEIYISGYDSVIRGTNRYGYRKFELWPNDDMDFILEKHILFELARIHLQDEGNLFFYDWKLSSFAACQHSAQWEGLFKLA